MTALKRRTRSQHGDSAMSRFGLVGVTIALVIGFSVALPSLFPTGLTLRELGNSNSFFALLALASMVPIAAGKFDISVGYAVGLAEVLAVVMQSRWHLGWGLSAVLIILIGGFIGAVNGFLVEFAQIDSFIATLGTGYVLYGVMFAITGGNEVLANLPSSFVSLGTGAVGYIPYVMIFVLVIALILWVILEFLPVGRFLYAVGANPRAAQLNGIPVRSTVVGAFVASGVLTAVTGVLLAAQLGAGEPSIGNNYLLPALVGALLGTTALRPGRANAWGTIVAIIVLAVGIGGLQDLGANYFVNPMFEGVTLLLAVGIAGVTTRRRARKRETAAEQTQEQRAQEALGTETPPDPNGSTAVSDASGAAPAAGAAVTQSSTQERES